MTYDQQIREVLEKTFGKLGIDVVGDHYSILTEAQGSLENIVISNQEDEEEIVRDCTCRCEACEECEYN